MKHKRKATRPFPPQIWVYRAVEGDEMIYIICLSPDEIPEEQHGGTVALYQAPEPYRFSVKRAVSII